MNHYAVFPTRRNTDPATRPLGHVEITPLSEIGFE